jgi:glycosyltransferase involved in cell wall biosynthesis
MRILINCSTLKKGGVLQVGHSFVSELMKRADHDYFFIISSEQRKFFAKHESKLGNNFFTYDVRPSVYLSLTGREKKLNRLIARIKPDAVFSVFAPTYWKPKVLHVCGFAKPSYIYPDSPFIINLPLLAKLKLLTLRKLHFNDFKYFNDALVTETADASGRLMRMLPSKKVFTVSNTYNQVYDEAEKWDNSIDLPEFDGISLLSITANYKHKNLGIIPGVISYLKNRYPGFRFRFVLTLGKDELNNICEKDRENIIFLGPVSIYQCPYLYQQSDLMFMPTLLECFTATYPEAMKMEVPVLTSDLPFAKDICADAAYYFDPMSPESIGEAIYSLAGNKESQAKLIERGKARLKSFDSSETRANKYIQILETLYETNNPKS